VTSTTETSDSCERNVERLIIIAHKAGKKYANAASDWFREFDQLVEVSDLAATDTDIEEADRLVDAREIIHWYQYQIAVKTIRALSSRIEEDEFEEDEGDEFPKDSDGSAKVALLGIDRSIAGWRLMQLSVPNARIQSFR
jgi:hypothetical protein